MGPQAPTSAARSAPGDDSAARLKRVKERAQTALAALRNNHTAMHEDNLMLAGGENQWDAQALAERKRFRRPIYTGNRFPASLAQITGEIRKNRVAIQCKPGDAEADPKVANIFEGLIRSIERLSQAPRVYSRAGKQTAACGMGHMRIIPVHAADQGFDVDLEIRGIKNVYSVLWDPAAQRDDKSDANWCLVVSELDKKGFEEAYPMAGSAAWAKAPTPRPLANAGWSSGQGGKVTVCEEWCVEKIPYQQYRLAHTQATVAGFHPETGVPQVNQPTYVEDTIDADHDGCIDGLAAEEFLDLQKAQGWEVVQSRTAYTRRITMTLWGGDVEIAEPVEWMGARIPIFTVLGEEIDVGDETIVHGIIRHAKDGQRYFNLTRSAQIEKLSQVTKTPTIVGASQIEGYEDEWEESTRRPKPFVRFEDRTNPNPPRERSGISTDPGLDAAAVSALSDIQDTTAIQPSALGKRGPETSGVAIDARNQQVDTSTFVYIDNLGSTIESIGAELVAAIPHYYSTRKQVMILGQDDAPTIVDLANVQMNLGKYHVVAKAGPSYQTQRDESADLIIETMKIAPPQAVPVLFEALLDLKPIPNADETIAKIKAVFAQMGLTPPVPGAGGVDPNAAMQPGAPGGPMPSPSGAPSNLVQFPPRGPGAPMRPDPLAGVISPISPPNAPAVRPRVGPPAMAAPPGN